ncbi:hypothetical protein ACNUDN_05946 [Mycobacterium sp. smrl_JER01]
MSGKRKKYTPEFREQAARLVIETGQAPAMAVRHHLAQNEVATHHPFRSPN